MQPLALCYHVIAVFLWKDEVNMVSMMIETESWILSRSRPSPPHSLQSIAKKNTELYEELSFPSQNIMVRVSMGER